MNDFFQELFRGAAKKDVDSLRDYEDEDLNNFFDSSVENPKDVLLEMAFKILNNLENTNQVNDLCKKSGLSGKNVEKLLNYIKKNKLELSDIKTNQLISDENRYHSFDWSVRSVFFGKKDEFKNQRKYAILNFGTKEGKENLALTCSKEKVEKIRGKLNDLDSQIKELFKA